MNVYDTANKLAMEIKSSEEYNNFKQAKQKINLNPEYKIKVAEFEKLRYEQQINSIQSGKNDTNQMKKMQEIYKNLIEIEEIKQYFDAELKFNILIGDINKMIGEAIQDIIT